MQRSAQELEIMADDPAAYSGYLECYFKLLAVFDGQIQMHLLSINIVSLLRKLLRFGSAARLVFPLIKSIRNQCYVLQQFLPEASELVKEYAQYAAERTLKPIEIKTMCVLL